MLKTSVLRIVQRSVVMNLLTVHAADTLWILNSKTDTAVWLCACAKCGSTSMMASLHEAIVGRHFIKLNERSSVQDWQNWDIDKSGPWHLNIDAPAEGTSKVALWVSRDPLERYFSAFRDKVMCCDPTITETQGATRVPCMRDKAHAPPVLASLLRWSIMAMGTKVQPEVLPCLYFTEYAKALRRVHEKGLQGKLDDHVKPQNRMCGVFIPRGASVVGGNVSYILSSFSKLYGLNDHHKSLRENTNTHAKFNVSADDIKHLCFVSELEYSTMSWFRRPEICDIS